MATAKLLTNGYGNDTRVRTTRVRLSFPNLFEKDKTTGKYGAVLLIPKDDESCVAVINEAIEAATQDGKERIWGGKIPRGLRSPLTNGDDSDYEGYAGCWAINAKSSKRIDVYDIGKDSGTIDDPEDIYPGCYVQAIIEFYPYDNQGKGVSVILEGIKKVAEGERLGGGGYTAGADDFDDDGDEDDDLGL